MNSTMAISKINVATNGNYYSKKLTAWCMKLKLNVITATLVRTKKCLIMVFTNHFNT